VHSFVTPMAMRLRAHLPTLSLLVIACLALTEPTRFTLQAAVLSAKLPHLARWTSARQAAAAIHDSGLNQIEDVVVPRLQQAEQMSTISILSGIRAATSSPHI
jgi:hypothetical protein